jgi:hypothetical protein
MSISSELSGALRYCGDIRAGGVDLPTLYEFYLDSCLTMDADLQLSESWRQLRVSPLVITDREQPLGSLEDFAFEVGLDYRAAGSEDRWRTVQIVAPERVSDVEDIRAWFGRGWWCGTGTRAASFYGEPRNVILSFDPTGFEFRLWWVSSSAADRSNQDEVSGLPETYAPLRKLLTAHKALPQCGHDETTYERLESVILRELSIWQPRWERFKNKPLKREGSRRPGYKRMQLRRRRAQD